LFELFENIEIFLNTFSGLFKKFIYNNVNDFLSSVININLEKNEINKIIKSLINDYIPSILTFNNEMNTIILKNFKNSLTFHKSLFEVPSII
jgi:hypothetical protein